MSAEAPRARRGDYQCPACELGVVTLLSENCREFSEDGARGARGGAGRASAARW